MRRLFARLRVTLTLLRRGEFGHFLAKLGRGLWSEHRYIALRRDLTEEIAAPASVVAFTIRPFAAGDEAALLASAAGPNDAEAQSLRRSWLDGGLNGCHVAVLRDGSPCYLQWLLTARENKRIRAFFGDTLPRLDAETVLLEGAYTPARYRRLPVMPAAMFEIAERGRELGARWVLVFVGVDSISMRKAAEWAGFRAYGIKIEQQRFFRRRVMHAPLLENGATVPDRPTAALSQ